MPENGVPPLVAAEVVEEPKTPWGFWMTMLLSLLVMVVFFAVQTGVGILCLLGAFSRGQLSPQSDPAALERYLMSGWILAASTWASLPCTLGAIYFFIRLRKRWSFSEYLGWKPVSLRQAGLAVAAVVAFAVANEFVSWLLGISIVGDFMKHVTETAGWLPLVWATMLVAAPVFEECFFRGFFFRGLQASALGNWGAVIITSIVWAVIHLQYDLYQIFVIFLGGCMFGIVRAKTGSCKITMGMHFFWNALAILEVYLFG